MQKEKRKVSEVVKVMATSLVLVGAFGFALMGANRLAFTNASARTVDIPQFEAMSVSQGMNASASSAENMQALVANALAAEQTPRRDLTVNETSFDSWMWGNHIMDENTLSAEEAAQIGAQYIYEVFGECVDGATVEMTFNGHLRHRGTLGMWIGTVSDGTAVDSADSADLSTGRPLFIFMINSETGEAIHVEQMTSFGEGLVLLSPRSDTPITFDMPNIRFESWFAEEMEVEVHREIHILPSNPYWFNLDDWKLSQEIAEYFGIWLVDKLDEFVHESDGAGGIIIRRFTPAPLIVPQEPTQDEETGGDGRQL